MKANIKLDFLVHDLLQTSPLLMSSGHKNCVETIKMYLYNLRLLVQANMNPSEIMDKRMQN